MRCRVLKIKKRMKALLNKDFHALTHRNYKYFWTGQCISLMGTWMQNVGQSWLVLKLTSSPFLLGLVGTIQFLPVMLFSLFAGIVVDKFPKKKILIATQTVSMIMAFILSFLVFSNQVKYWHVIILATILGFANTIDMPARQSFNIEIVGKEDLMNAIALNSAIFNLARVVGPAIGGVLMAYTGIGWCFLINGISYIAVIYGLLRIDAKPYVREKKNEDNIILEIKDGLRYIYKSPTLLKTMSMILIVGIFVFNFNVLIPVFTKNILGMGEKTYGFLTSSLGIGSLFGALLVSAKSKKGPKMNVMIRSSVIISAFLILLGIERNYYFTALLLGIIGIFNIHFSATANSTVQINSPDEYRGRIMSVYSLLFAGATPIGNLFAGTTANYLGADMGFLLSGVFTVSLIGILLMAFRFGARHTVKI